MEEQLFVRIRGRVQGPYELEQLRALVRRGQLSRMHEVSTDGSVWKQASSFPDLFVSPAVEAVQTAPGTRTSSKLSDAEIPDVESAGAVGAAGWHYSQNDEPKGPVTFNELKSLVTSGRLDSSALVWTDGMKEWEPAHTVPGLLPFSTGISTDGASATAKLDKEVLRTVFESCPWVKFIAFVLYLVGSIGAALGVAAIVMGARWNEAAIIASGGFSILYGGVSIWGGQLLYRYGADVAKLLREPSMRRLDVALRSLRRFWIFLSIILIVLLVNAIGITIWALSIGVSLSGKSL